MALKKPSDIFGNKSEDNNVPIIKSDNSFRDELSKVESLSEQVIQLQQELSQKVIKNDLESLVLSQINTMQENFDYLQNDFKKSNKKDIVEFKQRVSELTEIVGNLVENELPKYKKQVTKNEVRIGDKFDEFKNAVEENIISIQEDVDTRVENIAEVIDNNLEVFNNQLQETSSEVKRTTDTYNKLSKILENKLSKENEKLEEYSQIIQSLHEAFVELEKSLQEETSTYNQIIEEKFETISSDIKNKIDNIDEEVNIIKDKVSSEVLSIKADVVINEQHIKNVDKYLQEHHQKLVELKEEVFGEIEQIPVGNIQENLERLEKKIDYIKETYSQIQPEVIVKEVIKEGLLNEPPDTKNSDPLTPLDQNFVTQQQLENHYKLFINRIQQQLSTLGGGGETQLKYLDDIVGIATNASVYDGKFLKYNHSIRKFEFVTSGGGGESYWIATSVGIHTLSNVGIGTTNPTSKLTVVGDVTATDTRIQSLTEKSTLINGNTVNLVYNTGGGNIAICTNPTGPITLNVTGIPTDSTFNNNVLTFTVVAIQTSIGYPCIVINLNGASRLIRYPGGIVSVASTSSYDIFNFTGINTVGSASTTTNYQILGIVNGNFK